MRGVLLEDLTWAEAESRFQDNWPVLIPVGAFAKEHGLHLPLRTDSAIARHLARSIAEELPVVIAPVVGFGFYPAFVDYPGSQHLSAETFIALVSEILIGFAEQGARRMAVLNTGYSTEAPLRIAVREVLDRTGIRVAIADLRLLGAHSRSKLRQRGGGHADEHETSLMLAIDPTCVRLERAVSSQEISGPDTRPWALPGLLSRDPEHPDYSPTGATGEPALATVELGREILREITAELLAGFRRLYPDLA
ncbi:MAG TPA: creatininase family protein [Alphaproteobacteria bacterium]|nr:creatininase family protein [Alphaproteobacteria bacterium]